jgi:hypothetical protein
MRRAAPAGLGEPSRGGRALMYRWRVRQVSSREVGRRREVASGSTQERAVSFAPRFRYSHRLAQDLGAVEAARAVIELLPLAPDEGLRLRHDALQRSTRSSTQIEGNPLDQAAVRRAIAAGQRVGTAAEQEVRNYWRGLDRVEEYSSRSRDGSVLLEIRPESGSDLGRSRGSSRLSVGLLAFASVDIGCRPGGPRLWSKPSERPPIAQDMSVDLKVLSAREVRNIKALRPLGAGRLPKLREVRNVNWVLNAA